MKLYRVCQEWINLEEIERISASLPDDKGTSGSIKFHFRSGREFNYDSGLKNMEDFSKLFNPLCDSLASYVIPSGIVKTQ